MDIRNVQKTGSMFYVYLPTNWCKQFNIKAGAKVSTHRRNDGSLAISSDITEKELKTLELKVPQQNQDNINKLIVACYVNPLKSFSLTLEKELDISKLLLQKKLLSLELVEFDGKRITCESSFSVDDPLSLLRTMIKKIRNLLYIMKKNYNKELIDRYEEEIDRSNMHISKSVISMLTHNKPTKYKIIELHYMSTMAKDLERLVDHLREVPSTENKFIQKVESAIINLDSVFVDLDQKTIKSRLHYTTAMEFVQIVSGIPYISVKDSKTYHKVRVSAVLGSISEILANWSITEEIYKKTI